MFKLLKMIGSTALIFFLLLISFYLLKPDPWIVESARWCLQSRQNIEREFFALLKVNPKLPYYGQEGSYKATYQAYKHIGFYYDLESLKKMGLSDVEVIGGTWKPSENRKFENVYKVSHRDSLVAL